MNCEFDAYDKVKSMFNSKAPNEEWNAFFVAFKDIVADDYYVAAYNHNYDALIIGIGSNGGLAFYKLMRKKTFSKNDIKNMVVVPEEYMNFKYMATEFIDKVSIKRAPLSKKTYRLHIRFTTNEYHDLIVTLGKVDLPYQEDGINKFIDRYKKER